MGSTGANDALPWLANDIQDGMFAIDGHAARAVEEVHRFIRHAAGIEERGLLLGPVKQLLLGLKRPPLGNDVPRSDVLDGFLQRMISARLGTIAETDDAGPRQPADGSLIHDLDLAGFRPH